MDSKDQTEGRFDDLIQRIKTVEAVIGCRLLYHTPSGYNKKTVEKWLRRDAYPRRSSLQEFCHCAGMTLSAFKAPARSWPELWQTFQRCFTPKKNCPATSPARQCWK